MENYLVTVIRKLRPESVFSFWNNDYSTIVWHVLEGEAPTQAEIDLAIEQVKADEKQAEIDKATAKAALLERLGITELEAALLLG